MNHFGHFLGVAALVIALAALLIVRNYTYHKSSADLYSAYIAAHWPTSGDNNNFATDEQQETLRIATHEGVCWANRLYTETNVWAALAVILLLILLAYHFASQKYFV